MDGQNDSVQQFALLWEFNGLAYQECFWAHSNRKKREHTHTHIKRNRRELIVREYWLRCMMNKISFNPCFSFHMVIVHEMIFNFIFFTVLPYRKVIKRESCTRRQESVGNQLPTKKGWKLWNRCMYILIFIIIWNLFGRCELKQRQQMPFGMNFLSLFTSARTTFGPKFARFIVWAGAHVSRLS